MKNNKLKKGIRDIKDIKLSSSEKLNLFTNFESYVKNHPVLDAPKVNIWSSFFLHYKYSYAISALLLCIFVSASVTYAAESALPGDILYPIKIYITEPVKAATKVTQKAKAKYEEERVMIRLDEVQELVKKGKFEDTIRAQVEKEVEKSVNTINNMEIKKIRNKDRNENASSTDDFRKKLDSHFQNIRKADVELKLDTPKEHDNKDQVEKFERKIKVQIGGFINEDTEARDTNDNKNNKDNNAKDNNRGRGLYR